MGDSSSTKEVKDEEDSDRKRRKELKKERKEKKKQKKEKKKDKKRRRDVDVPAEADEGVVKKKKKKRKDNSSSLLPFDHEYILAPMVGASELPFRLLCRKYGAQLAYTPMMSSARFVQEPAYREEIFQTNALDRPLVCHFSANTPSDFEQAVRSVQNECDAIDLNLGCPQRTAYLGHFGSYLLDPPDRQLICDIVRAGVNATTPPKPIFVKIRLLSTLQETIELCQQLKVAGASLIAIHARHRATWERKGPGARDGPALLEQVTQIKEAVKDIAIIANGNVISYEDVVDNAALTKADGVMSAEGILDNPALFLPRLGRGGNMITLADPLLHCPELNTAGSTDTTTTKATSTGGDSVKKRKRKLTKKIREMDRIQAKIDNDGESSINEEQRLKLAARKEVETAMRKLEKEEERQSEDSPASKGESKVKPALTSSDATVQNSTTAVPLSQLYDSANDKIALAMEYLRLAKHYGPTTMRTQIFHVRRMMKDILNNYQLMSDCLECTTEEQLGKVVQQCKTYQDDPNLFVYDRNKAKAQAEALERKKHEEGKRKAYEARMIRKAKREGKLEDLEYYLRLGAAVPTQAIVRKLRKMKEKKQQLEEWKENDHTQHCLAYHLESGCQRGRACAFLHVDAVDNESGVLANAHTTAFEEQEEVAG